MRRELWVPPVQQALWEARVTRDPKVRLVLGAQLVRRVTTARLEQQVLGVRLVRRVRRVILDTPDTPEIPATGVRLVPRVI